MTQRRSHFAKSNRKEMRLADNLQPSRPLLFIWHRLHLTKFKPRLTFHTPIDVCELCVFEFQNHTFVIERSWLYFFFSFFLSKDFGNIKDFRRCFGGLPPQTQWEPDKVLLTRKGHYSFISMKLSWLIWFIRFMTPYSIKLFIWLGWFPSLWRASFPTQTRRL